MLISSYKFACIGTLSLLMASSQVHSADVIKVGDTSIYASAVWRAFRIWRRPQPINSVESLADFCFQRAAFIAQTTLYGYLRTRSGLQHFNLFTDAKFTALLRPARSRLVLVCLDDLAIHAAAQLGGEGVASAQQMSQCAARIFAHGCSQLGQAEGEADLEAGVLVRAQTDFEAGLSRVDWSARSGMAGFSKSPQALIDLAPVIDKVKAYDTEIVMNSMRFKWQGIRVELRERLQLDDILYLEISRLEAGEAAPPSERAFGAGP
jgi:hypothetical protein